MQIDIRDLRRRLGDISQAELGRRLGGLDQSTVSRMEAKGEADGPVALLLQHIEETAPKEPLPNEPAQALAEAAA